MKESVIPMNFNWRSGIGTTQQNPGMSSPGMPMQGQVNPNYTAVPNKGEVYQSVLGEAMYVINMFVSQYYGKPLSVNDNIIVKTSIQNKLRESLGIYKKFLDVDFIQYAQGRILDSDLRGVVDKSFIIECFNSLVTHQQPVQQQING